MPPTTLDEPRSSLEALDQLLKSASAQHQLSIDSPDVPAEGFPRPQGPTPPETPLDIPDEDLEELPPARRNLLETVWEEVLSAKSKGLEASPSKVKSLGREAVLPMAMADPPVKRKVAKRRSRVDVKESPDGRNLIITFDLVGVKKQDMHVSYRTTRLIVSWRMERVAEVREGNAVVRDREVRKYSHTIPLPEGTKFEDVRASRDGHRLKLTIPNSKCVRADAEDVEEPADPQTIPDVDTSLSAVTEYHSCTSASVA
ncbi:hypothetical protein BD414DRAFT_523943 [Trametes punicea]|nr:hypothetical protein BD414DRAFT_523943 [Trametes punicea]